jgi:hypothetical protein
LLLAASRLLPFGGLLLLPGVAAGAMRTLVNAGRWVEASSAIDVAALLESAQPLITSWNWESVHARGNAPKRITPPAPCRKGSCLAEDPVGSLCFREWLGNRACLP